MIYHMTALLCGFIIDLIAGDPYCIPHPIRMIGSLISYIEKKQRRAELSESSLRKRGLLLVILVCFITALVSGAILGTAYYINRIAGCIIETVMTWQILAIKSLRVESMKVYKALRDKDTEKARGAVAMIVGRDTDVLDEAGITRAAVETVAENTSDGVIAPMIYLAIGGPVLGFFYKAVNTMDSMVGYKNEKYLHYGRAAAKLDDIVNYIPARISAILMILATLLSGKQFDTANAIRIFRRDRYNHASPNSAQTESVCAGAMGLRLAGDTSYFGKVVSKPYIGDDIRGIEPEDIAGVNRLMFITALLCLLISLGILTVPLLLAG